MKKIVLKLIWFYQHAISPYKGRGYCNYYPTCSQYAKEAIEMYGFTKGGFMAFKRIIRCNPFVTYQKRVAKQLSQVYKINLLAG